MGTNISLKYFLVVLVLTMQFTAKAQLTTTFVYTGGVQTFTVPQCVTTLSVDLRGAQGGAGYNLFSLGGNGGRVTGTIAVSSGEVLEIYVGGMGTNGSSSTLGAGGFNGGGNGNLVVGSYGGGGGGGASDIRSTPYGIANRLAVAGGGGGGGYNFMFSGYDRGGMGGGLIGEGGYGNNMILYNNQPGDGGSQTVGGAGGLPSPCTSGNGSLGLGGNSCTGSNHAGGGGGGGYYGGGGGTWFGGGGGSSYLINGVHTQGFQAGNGSVIISYSLSSCISTAVSAQTICLGETVTITASGVSTYTWLPVGTFTGSNASSITHNPASTTIYTVQGTNTAGYVSVNQVTVYVNNPQVNVAASHSIICLGQSSTLTASGASTYSWSSQNGSYNTITNGELVVNSNTMPSGVYYVIGKDAIGCTAPIQTVAVTVSIPTLAISGATAICQGFTTTLIASGANTYTWSNNNQTTSITIAPTSTTQYYVSGTNENGCVGTSSVITISTFAAPTLSVNNTSYTLCNPQTQTLTVSGAYSYVWKWDNTPSFATTTFLIVHPAVTTQYTVTGANQIGCTSNKIITISIIDCVGIDELKNEHLGLKVYPNPLNEVLIVESLKFEEGLTISIYNALGNEVHHSVLNSQLSTIDLRGLESGIYFVKVGNAVKKILKE